MRIDLDDLLQPDDLPSAGDLFVDRTDESNAYEQSLAAHIRRIRDENAEPGCRNVLMFYGGGGIGKSTLSRRLEAWTWGTLQLDNGWGSPPQTDVAAIARIDLHTSEGALDVEEALLAIRFAFGRIKRRWPAFDIAFATYWASVHPGTDFPRFADGSDDLGDAIVGLISDLAGDVELLQAPITIGLRYARILADTFARDTVRRRALSDSPAFAELLQRCAREPSVGDPRPTLLASLAGLLAQDLSRMPEPPLVVVFIDTVERLTRGDRSAAESLLNRIIFLMPNVLFVLTGRDKLNWANANRVGLFKAGPSNWPQLVLGDGPEPRQHLVGKLSVNDRREVIRRGRDLYRLPISDDVVESLVVSSGGLPQYLDLALSVALSVVENGGTEVTAADVAGSLGELVSRVLRDVPADEQRAIRAAALVLNFDVELVAAMAGVDTGCVLRAFERPMIDKVDGPFPYRMHDEIREALRSAGHEVANGWDIADWSAAAARGLEHLRERYDRATAGGVSPDAIAALGLAISIVCEVESPIAPAPPPEAGGPAPYHDWLSRALVFAPSITGLQPYLPTSSRTDYGSQILRFVEAKGRSLPPSERQAIFREIAASTSPLARPAARHLAYSLRDVGRWDEALEVLADLVENVPSRVHTYQHAYTLYSARRFAEAEAEVPLQTPTNQVNLKDNLALAHGRLDEWLEHRAAAMERQLTGGRHREYLESLGVYLRTRTFVRGDVPEAELHELLSLAESVGHVLAIRDALSALVLSRRSLDQEAGEWLATVIELDAASNEGSIDYRGQLARGAVAFRAGDRAELGRIRDDLEARPYPRSRMWIPLECLLDREGFELTPVPTQWLEPYPQVRARWTAIFDAFASR